MLALFRSAQSANFELDDVALIEILSRQAMTLAGEQRDGLTGLLSRAAFERRVGKALAANAPHGTLLYLNVRELAAINSACGFAVGDEVIVRTAQLIRKGLCADECACRLSGDRFVLHLPGSNAGAAAKRGAEYVAAAEILGGVGEAGRTPVALGFGVAAPPPGTALGRHWVAAAEQACREP
jgi:diguanylate cyclase (GGDEF)-like protein